MLEIQLYLDLLLYDLGCTSYAILGIPAYSIQTGRHVLVYLFTHYTAVQIKVRADCTPQWAPSLKLGGPSWGIPYSCRRICHGTRPRPPPAWGP